MNSGKIIRKTAFNEKTNRRQSVPSTPKIDLNGLIDSVLTGDLERALACAQRQNLQGSSLWRLLLKARQYSSTIQKVDASAEVQEPEYRISPFPDPSREAALHSVYYNATELKRAGEWVQAEEMFQVLSEEEGYPEMQSKAAFQIGEMFIWRGDYDSAVPWMKKAVGNQRDYRKARMYLILLLHVCSNSARNSIQKGRHSTAKRVVGELEQVGA